MHRSQSHALAASVFAALGVIVYALRDHSSCNAPVRIVSSRESNAPRRRCLELAVAPRVSTREPLGPATSHSSDVRVEVARANAAASVLRGTLLYDDTLEPACDHDVALWGDDATSFVRALSDASGAFQIAWSPSALPLERLVHVGIRGPEGVAALHGLAPLRQGMTLLVSRPQRAHGRLVGLGACMDAAATTVTAMTVPDRRVWERVVAGRVAPDADGRFAMLIPGYGCSDAFDVLVSTRDGAEGTVSQIVPASSLLDAAGASIALAVCRLRVVVEDEHGELVRGAAVQAAPLDAAQRAPQPEVLTREDGSATLLVPASKVELCVFHAGSRASIEELDVPPCELVHRVRLRRDGAAPLEGEVLLYDGTPVAGASATLYPTSRAETGLAALQAVRTSDDGRFRIARDAERTSLLTVFHRDHGIVEDRVLTPDVRFVRVYLEPLGDLRVDVAARALGPDAPVGALQYCLAEIERDRVHSGVLGLPSVIQGVPAGTYNVFVRGAGGEGFGRAHAVVAAGGDAHVAVELVDGSACLGEVVDESGAPIEGARVRLVDPSWPDELIDWWGSTTTDARGRFCLVAGADARAALEVFGPSGEPTRASASAGHPATIVVR